jgi:hypothetical protein
VVDKDQPIIIWNPQLVQSALPTPNFNTDNIYSNCNMNLQSLSYLRYPETPVSLHSPQGETDVRSPRGYDVAGVGGGEFALRLVPRQRAAPHYWRSSSHTHTIVKDNGNNNNLVPSQCTQSACYHLICPLQNHPFTQNQLRLCSAHMINCIIAEELMPTPALCTCPPSLHCRYAFTAECILLETISLPFHSTVHFINAIINNNTGNILEYQHLMKMDKHKKGTTLCSYDQLRHCG